jgi:hypothetical protein
LRSEKKRALTEPQGIETDTATYSGLEGPTELSGSMLLETAVRRYRHRTIRELRWGVGREKQLADSSIRTPRRKIRRQFHDTSIHRLSCK